MTILKWQNSEISQKYQIHGNFRNYGYFFVNKRWFSKFYGYTIIFGWTNTDVIFWNVVIERGRVSKNKLRTQLQIRIVL